MNVMIVLQYEDGSSANSSYNDKSIDFKFLMNKPQTIDFYGKVFELIDSVYIIKDSTLTLYYGEI